MSDNSSDEKPQTLPAISRFMDETSINSVLESIRSARTQQRSLLQTLNTQMEKRGAELDASLGSHVSAAERKSVTDRAGKGFRQELIASSAPQRTELMRSAARYAEATKSVAEHYSSPTAMLMRETIGSERRSRIQSQIQSSGPKELASLAGYAAATQDAELAAALIGRNSTIRAGQRSFSSMQLAASLFGERHRAVVAALDEIATSAQAIFNDDRALTHGRANPLNKVTRGLRQQGISK